MLQVIDTQCGRFAKSNRAQMPSDFYSALVGSDNGGRKLRRSDEHVGLEIVHTLIHPVICSFGCVFRPSELVELHSKRSWALEIRAGDMHFRAGSFSCINLFLCFEISVGLERAGGTNCGDTSG